MAAIRMVFLSACVIVAPLSAAADGSVTLTISDRLGRAMAAPFSLIAPDGKSLPDATEPGKAMRVPAGSWNLVPKANARLARQISVADGQDLAVTINAPDSLWISVAPEYASPSLPLLIAPKDSAAIAKALATFEISRRYTEPLAAKRPAASPEAAAAALALARNAYGKPPAERDEAGANQHINAQIWAGRIISALGDNTDVQRLTGDTPLYDASDDLMIAARIEQRLGTIENGRLAALANGKSDRAARAAVALHQAGVRRWTERIGEALLNPPKAPGPSEIWLAAVGLRSPAIDRAFAGGIDRLVARTAEIVAMPEKQREDVYNEYNVVIFPLMLRALVNNNDDQLKKLASYPIQTFELVSLAPFVANPEAIARLMMLRSDSQDADDVASLGSVAALCPVLDLLPANDAEATWRELVASVREAGDRAARGRTYLAPGVARGLPDNFVNYFSTTATACRPTAYVPYRLFEGNEDSLRYTSWIPRRGLHDELIGFLVNPRWKDFNWRQVDMVLETMPIEAIERALAAKGSARPAYPIDIYLAYRKVATRGDYLFPGYYEAGWLNAMRRELIGRPYVFASKSYDGGLTGIARVRVEPRDDATRIYVRLDQRPYYGSSGLFENRSNRADWKFHPYTLDRGRKLIRDVKLMKDDRPIALKELPPDANGDPVFEAPRLDSFAGTVLQIDLAMFEENRSLLFELFAAQLPAR